MLHITIPSLAVLNLMADMPMQLSDMSNCFFCPACGQSEVISPRGDIIKDIVHAENCPVIWAKNTLVELQQK